MGFLSKEITLFKQAFLGISHKNIQWLGVYETKVNDRYIVKSAIMETPQLCLLLESTCGKYRAEKFVNRRIYTAFSPGMRYGKASFLSHKSVPQVWLSEKTSERAAIYDVMKNAWFTIVFYLSVFLVVAIGASYFLTKVF